MINLKWIGAGVVALSTLGLGLSEMWEYLAVARADVAEAIKERIPLTVEIDRLQLLVSRLDEQIEEHKHQVARSAVALERTQQDVAAASSEQQTGLQKIADLRNALRGDGLQVRVGCTAYSKAEVERALQVKVERYKGARQSVQQRELALERQRDAFRTQAGGLADLEHQRRLLAQKVETLRSEHAAQQMITRGKPATGDNDTLRRAQQLAIQIEDRLKVEQKKSELDVDPSEPVPTASATNAASEADRLLAEELGTDPAA